MGTSITRYLGSIPSTESSGRTSTVSNVSSLISDETLLVLQLRAGEEEAFAAVVTRYQETLIRMAMRYVANRATAEEVVQETWIAVLSGLNRFEGRSSLYAWICAIVIYKAKDRGVREKRQKVFSDFEWESDAWNGEPDPSRFRPHGEGAEPAACSQHLWDDRTPEKLLASRQATACLWRAIEMLPAFQREVLILRDVHGIHTKEVCQQLKITETNFYVRLHRARERVKAAVAAALG